MFDKLDKEEIKFLRDLEAKVDQVLANQDTENVKLDEILAQLAGAAPAPGPTPPPPPPTTGTVAWTNTDPAVADSDVVAWVTALNAQVPDIQALWPHVQEWWHCFVAAGQTPPVGAISAVIKPTLPEAPGALAYHDVDANGQPFMVVGSQTCLQAGVTISSAMSHEATELTVDPGCQLTFTAPDGRVWAGEVADPTESDSYSITPAGGATVWVSNLVGQAFFGAGPGPLDHTGVVTAPLTIRPGGYAIIDSQPVYGEQFPAARKASVEALGVKGTPRRPVG